MTNNYRFNNSRNKIDIHWIYDFLFLNTGFVNNYTILADMFNN